MVTVCNNNVKKKIEQKKDVGKEFVEEIIDEMTHADLQVDIFDRKDLQSQSLEDEKADIGYLNNDNKQKMTKEKTLDSSVNIKPELSNVAKVYQWMMKKKYF